MTEQINWSEGFQVQAGHMKFGRTEASPETQDYWDGVMRNELMLKRCLGCRRFLHPRRMACPDCYFSGVESARSAGQGNVYSFSTVYRPPDRDAVQQESSYCVGIVHLSEDVYLFTRFISKSGTEPRIGDAATLDFAVLGGQKVPVFHVK